MSAPTANRPPKQNPERLPPMAELSSVFATAATDEERSGNNSNSSRSVAATAGTSTTKGAPSTSASLSPSSPSASVPASAAAAAAGAALHSVAPQPMHWDAHDTTRGWEPNAHGRLRFSLNRHFREDESMASPFSKALPEDLSAEAAAQRALEDAVTPTNDALLNVCNGVEARVEMELQTSVINAINNAYTSSGYPSVTAAGNARGAVYGSFVDLKNPSVHTLNLPPRESVIVAPSSGHGGSQPQAPTQPGERRKMETLVKVLWHRSSGMFTPAVDGRGGGQGSGKRNSAGGSGAGSVGATQLGSSVPISPAAAAAVGMQRPTTLQQHIQQYPEGIHGRHSSPHLRNLVFRGEYPMTADEAGVFPTASPAPGTAGAAAAAAPGIGPTSSPTAVAANVPPPGRPPSGSTPVMHTLVSANTFNHLSVYFVAHQDGEFLYSAPVQTLSASIATRKVTAHHLFMMGREEVDPVEDLDGYELQFTSTGSFSTNLSTSGPGKSNENNNRSDCVNGRRERLSFRPLAVPEEARAVFFDSPAMQFGGANSKKRTINAALVGFQVEPLLLFGNQNGDIFLHSILEEKIVQRFNFNAGLSTTVSGVGGGSAGGDKFICSPVSSIVEVQNGLEKKLSSLVQNAALAKQNDCGYVKIDELAKYPHAVPGSTNPNKSGAYFSLSPSLFAAGFDCGQVLLLCVTSEGGWVLKHFPDMFGLRPIQRIAPRVPSFFVRLWASYATAPSGSSSSTTRSPMASGKSSPKLNPAGAKKPSAASATNKSPAAAEARCKSLVGQPSGTLIHAVSTLFVPNEEQHVAAISCRGGVVALVRLPGLEILSFISVYDYSAVGEVLALSWSASTAAALLTPDLLFASGEDDIITVFQLISTAVIPRSATAAAGAFGGPLDTFAGVDAHSTISSEGSFHVSSGLRILERKKFHHTWVNHLTVMPLVLPVSYTGSGMPQYLGTAVLATSYDDRTSFWPVLFNNTNNSNGSNDGSGGGYEETGETGQYFLVDGPTAAYPLHTELVIGTAVGGGGTSHFLASVCCRGRVRLWNCVVKTGDAQ